MSVYFFSQGTSFSLKKKSILKKLLLSIIRKEKEKAGKINFIFSNDKFLHALNKKFLKQNMLTDIIAFQYSFPEITADIYISIPRVKENAKKFNVSFENELHRVMIHGILHLCGYKDKKKQDKNKMNKAENRYLRQFGYR